MTKVKRHPSFLEFAASYIALSNQRGANYDFPDFHQSICVWLQETMPAPRRLLMAFREAGKSLLVCLYVVWRLLLNPNYCVVIVCGLEKHATQRASFIRLIIETHPMTKHLVPTGDSEQWQRNTFTVKRPGLLLHPSVLATSITATITSTHGDELISDDIEHANNAKTAEQRNLIREHMREFTSMCQFHTYIGTPHGSPSIYQDFEAKNWPTLRFPVYEDADGKRNYTWPKMWGEARVEISRADTTDAYFRSQYLLEYVSINETLLPVDLIREYNADIQLASYYTFDEKLRRHGTITIDGEQRQLVDLLGWWDPASGLAGRDDSVIAILARDQDGRSYVHRCVVLPPVIRGEDVLEPYAAQTAKIIETMQSVGCNKLFVEEKADDTLGAEIKRAANRAKVKLQVISVSQSSNKKVRIADTMDPAIKSGRCYMHVSCYGSPLIGQLRDFPHCVSREHDKDDCIDAVASGIAQLQKIHTRFDAKSKMIEGIVNGDRSTHAVKNNPFRVDTRDRFKLGGHR